MKVLWTKQDLIAATDATDPSLKFLNNINGISGIDYITSFKTDELPVTFAGEVKNFDANEYMGKQHESKVTMEAKLEEDLEIDSLGIVEVVMAFEDEFEIEIDDDELANVSTVGQAVQLLHSKI